MLKWILRISFWIIALLLFGLIQVFQRIVNLDAVVFGLVVGGVFLIFFLLDKKFFKRPANDCNGDSSSRNLVKRLVLNIKNFNLKAISEVMMGSNKRRLIFASILSLLFIISLIINSTISFELSNTSEGRIHIENEYDRLIRDNPELLLKLRSRVKELANYTWHQSPNIKVSFAYPDKFKPASFAEPSTLFLVNWRTKSGSLMVTCFLKAIKRTLNENNARQTLKNNSSTYVQSVIKSEKNRVDEVSIISQKPIKIDGLDAVYYVLRTKVLNFDRIEEFNTYNIVTFWNNHEILLTCGTSLPYALKGQVPKIQIDAVVKNVEEQIDNVLRTLHFDRN